MSTRHWNLLAISSAITLCFFALAWELWLAPLRPGGSSLALKALPLLVPLFGLLRQKRYTHQWCALLTLIYLAEALVRIGSDPEGTRWAPAIELLLAAALFAGCVGYARATRPGVSNAQGFKPAD